MKIPLALAVVALLLAGCTATPPGPVVAAAVTPTPTPEATSSAPACRDLVGKPIDQVFIVGKGPQCITGATVAIDKTEYSVMNCDPVGNTGTTIYGWSSTDPNAIDRQVYAAKQDGVVVIVPVSASTVEMLGGVPVANYLLAVGCQ